MATTTQHTATIHQFPLRGRFAQTAQYRDRDRNDLDAWRPQFVAAESSWYHDEAVREERNRKN